MVSNDDIGNLDVEKVSSGIPTRTVATANLGLVLPPPDGGALAWSQVFAGHLINAVTWGYVTGFGVFQTHYQETLPNSPSAISWIGGVQVFFCFSIGTFSGRATDAGLARPVVFVGSLFLVVGTFMTSLATTYWQIFLAQGLCVGIGLGLIWLPSVTLISTYFARKRVLAVTSSAAGASTGSVIFPAMIQYLTPQIGTICSCFETHAQNPD